MSAPEVTLADRVLGRSAVELVADHLGSTRTESEALTQRQFFRISNFTAPNIHAFLREWQDRPTQGTGIDLRDEKVVQIVIAVNEGEQEYFEPRYLVEPGKSITWYRNHNHTGRLVYIERGATSDGAGLKNIFTLRDRNFLDGEFEDARKYIIKYAHERASGRNWSGQLERRILEVLNRYPAKVAVRRFVQFVCQIMEEHHDLSGALSEDEIDQLVGRNLTGLKMFGDESWRAGSTETAIRRRLRGNVLHADLASSESADLDIDQCAERAQKCVFRDEMEEEYGKREQTRWRKLCETYLREEKGLEDIPYRIFEQIFSRVTKGQLLGERVRGELEERSSSSRVHEFDDLKVKEGLDRKTPESAQRFLDHDPVSEDDKALRDLLTRTTRRMVEHAANPKPQRFSNPFTTVAGAARRFRDREDGDHPLPDDCSVRLSVRTRKAVVSEGLFAFLYGASLEQLAADSALGIDGMRFEVDSRLTTVVAPPEVREELDPADSDGDQTGVNEEDQGGVTWSPIVIDIELLDGDKKPIQDVLNYEWVPESVRWSVLFWLSLAAPDAPRLESTLTVPEEFGEWIDRVIARDIGFDASHEEALVTDELRQAPALGEFLDALDRFRVDVSAHGINEAALGDLVDGWSVELETAKQHYLPDGSVPPGLTGFLSRCTVRVGEHRVILLPSHPLRLRWLARYLRRSYETAAKALAGDLPLNRQNGSLYLDWIAQLSPHQQPALTVGQDGNYVFATHEEGWSEEYAPVGSETGGRSEVAVDSMAMEELVGQLKAYLDAHPYKKDGLSILIVLKRGSEFPAELVSQLRRGDWAGLHLMVRVVAPAVFWEPIARSFEQLRVETRMSGGSQLFPPIQLRLYDVTTDLESEEVQQNLKSDVAVIPHLLRDDVKPVDQTEVSVERPGGFNPLYDRPTVVFGGMQGGVISVSMRPKEPDPVLESWSSLVVRHHRKSLVSKDAGENIDYVNLNIEFLDTAKTFNAIHRCAHWVVVLERHITRQQIEALESGPDILSVKEGVGAGGLYTLVVSSNSGKVFIIERLQRKLRKIFGAGGDASVTEAAAARLYDETRRLAPKLALKAMGISRVTEEVLGLMVARRVAEHKFPVDITDGVMVWISIDEHPEWFRGSGTTRADLCRITMRREETGFTVDLLVVEGKLRTGHDPHGVQQVAESLELFRDMLPNTESEEVLLDAELWRTKLLAAMESVNPDAQTFYGSAREHYESQYSMLPDEYRSNFRTGTFAVGCVQGLFSSANYETDHDPSVVYDHEGSVTIARTYRSEIVKLASAGVGRPEPVADATPAAAPTPVADPTPGADPPPVVDPISVADATPAAAPTPVADPTPGADPPPVVDPISAADPTADAIVQAVRAITRPPGPGPRPASGPTFRKALGAEELDRRYQKILDTMAEHKVKVHRVRGGTEPYVEGPASILFRIKPGEGVDPKRIQEKADALKINLALAQEHVIRFVIADGYMNIEVPKKETDRYYVMAHELWLRWTARDDQLVIPVGEDNLGEVISLNFSSSNSPHLLIGGTTGSGKSEALMTILKGLTRYYTPEQLKLHLIDPKGTELESFDNSPHLMGTIGWDDDDAIEILEQAVAEMQSRYQKMKDKRTKKLPEYNRHESVTEEERLPWWVVVLDEYADLTSDPEKKKVIEASLKRLAQKARAAGIHVIIATQKPSADVISTVLRSNLPAQLALRVKSATESRVVMDESGAETLNGKGDALLKADGKITRIQCGYVGEGSASVT
jgi:hypothetical protein